MISKVYDTLPEEAAMIRRAVFMDEQGFVQEFDETDHLARHIVLFDGETPVAVCRFFPGDTPGDYIVGRIAVMKPYRSRGLGAEVLAEAEAAVFALGGTGIRLHAQVSAKGFYEKQGYAAYGEEDLDEDCPHIWMRKTLNSSAIVIQL